MAGAATEGGGGRGEEEEGRMGGGGGVERRAPLVAQFFHVGLPPARGPVSSHFNARKQIRTFMQPTRWVGAKWKGLEQKLANGPAGGKAARGREGGVRVGPHLRFFEPKNARLGHKLGRAHPCAPTKPTPSPGHKTRLLPGPPERKPGLERTFTASKSPPKSPFFCTHCRHASRGQSTRPGASRPPPAANLLSI